MALAAGEGGGQSHAGLPSQPLSRRLGAAGGYWIVYNAEKGEWEAKA
jgi:hypothetical protein